MIAEAERREFSGDWILRIRRDLTALPHYIAVGMDSIEAVTLKAAEMRAEIPPIITGDGTIATVPAEWYQRACIERDDARKAAKKADAATKLFESDFAQARADARKAHEDRKKAIDERDDALLRVAKLEAELTEAREVIAEVNAKLEVRKGRAK
jgi:hypothetical protein